MYQCGGIVLKVGLGVPKWFAWGLQQRPQYSFISFLLWRAGKGSSPSPGADVTGKGKGWSDVGVRSLPKILALRWKYTLGSGLATLNTPHLHLAPLEGPLGVPLSVTGAPRIPIPGGPWTSLCPGGEEERLRSPHPETPGSGAGFEAGASWEAERSRSLCPAALERDRGSSGVSPKALSH